jgi:hypothetical protein
MAQFVVLEDFIDNKKKLRAGKVIDDALYDVPALKASGLAVVAYVPATMEAAVKRFVAVRRAEAEQPISLVGLFLSEGLFP